MRRSGRRNTIRNPFKTSSRYLLMAIPAGLDGWFAALDAVRQAGTLDDAMARKPFLVYGMERLE